MPWAIAASCTTAVGRIDRRHRQPWRFSDDERQPAGLAHTHRALHPALLPQNTFTIIHNEIPASFIIAPAHNFNASLLNCEQPCHLTASIYSDIPVCCATYLGVPRPPPRLTYHDCLFFPCAVRCDHIRPCRRLCHHTYLPLGLTCRNKTHGHSFQRPACYTNASYCFLTQTLEQPPPLLPSFSLSTLNKNRGGEISKLCPKSASTNIANVPSVLNVRVIRAIHLGGYPCQKKFTQWQRLRLNSRERKRPCSPRCKQTFTLFSGPPK